MSLTTRYLEAFHAVCEAGTLRRAAERLFVSQPAISYQIRKLESDVGTPLFDRVGRRLLLTAEGRRLRDFCGRYFAELSVLDAELRGRAPTWSEPLRLAAVSVFGRSVLFPLLCGPGFAHLKLELRYRTASEVFEMVERGECDVGATYLGKVSSSLELKPVYVEELALIVPPAGPTADAVQELEAFESLPLITYDESDYVFGAWCQKVYRAQPAATSSVHHFEELEEVVEMVALGRGSSVVPLDAAREAVGSGRVRVLRPSGERCLNREYLVFRPGAFVRPEVRELARQLAAASAASDLAQPTRP